MKIGLIGYGYWGGGFVARNIARVAELAVIVDPNVARLMEAAAKWTPWGTRVSSEPEVAFRECDAVWIATPARTHYDLCIQALEAGCHVMCEKPFVMSLNEAFELTQEAKSLDVALQVGFTALYMQQHERASYMVRHGMAPYRVRSRRITGLPSESDVNVLWGLGPHDIAALVDLFGSPTFTSWEGNDHRVVADMMFNDATRASLEFDWLSHERERVFDINGVHFAMEPDLVEPLFREAQAFVNLCADGRDEDRAEARHLARCVTEVLSVAAEKLLEVRS